MNDKEDIRVFKLSTGEDIVGIVISEDRESIYLNDPLVIKKMVEPNEGKVSIYFMIWGELKGSDQPVYLNPDHIISYYWLEDEDYDRVKKIMDTDDNSAYSMAIN